MRFAIFSDVHGNLAAPEAVLADMQQWHVDRLICLGGLAAEGPHPGQVIGRIRGLGCPVSLGNGDAWHKEPLPAGWQPAGERQAMIYHLHHVTEGAAPPRGSGRPARAADLAVYRAA